MKHVKLLLISSIVCVVALCGLVIWSSFVADRDVPVLRTEALQVTEDYLEPNEFSRPQTKLKKIKGIVIHYTANPGTDAKANRDYFNGLPASNLNRENPLYVSSHYVVGLDGSIIQCIPLDEIAYASNERNEDTISIEVCHEDLTGKFNKKTYKSLVRLVAWLSGEYNLKKSEIIRHYDITGKNCPKY